MVVTAVKRGNLLLNIVHTLLLLSITITSILIAKNEELEREVEEKVALYREGPASVPADGVLIIIILLIIHDC